LYRRHHHALGRLAKVPRVGRNLAASDYSENLSKDHLQLALSLRKMIAKKHAGREGSGVKREGIIQTCRACDFSVHKRSETGKRQRQKKRLFFRVAPRKVVMGTRLTVGTKSEKRKLGGRRGEYLARRSGKKAGIRKGAGKGVILTSDLESGKRGARKETMT